MRKNSGFTIYELMVTIAIMALIAAITMPPYLKWFRTSRLRSAVSSFTVDLEMAKTEAIRKNGLVVIEFYSGRYKIFVDSNKDWDSSGENILLNRVLPPSVSIDTATLSLPTVNDKVRFNSRGIPADIVTPETIGIIQAGNNRQITINRLGNINVQ
ncbi:MAG: GspH/FimT family protein [Desulfobacterales bacterium]|nr:GspH/FimT family protein [Desulfobacterales bacterium]